MKRTILIITAVIACFVLAGVGWGYFVEEETRIVLSKAEEMRAWYASRLRIHIGGGGLAMLLGVGLMITANRSRWLKIHRWLGRGYALVILISGVAGLMIAPYAIGGWVSALGLLSLGVLWLLTTGATVFYALRGQLERHRYLAILSLALTFSAFTLRLFLLIPMITELPFVSVYKFSVWASWIINLSLALWLTKPINSQVD